MAAIHETAYPRVKPMLSLEELDEIFKPTNEEKQLLEKNNRKTFSVSCLGFMLTLKYYQYLGRVIAMNEIDEYIKDYVYDQLQLSQKPNLAFYGKSTRKRHIRIIRQYLNINQDNKQRQQVIEQTALDAATTKENLADIVNCIIDELIKLQFELPTYQYLVTSARKARSHVNNHYYIKITGALSEAQKQLIDTVILAGVTDGSIETELRWATLKQEPKKPSINNVREYIAHVNQLRALHQLIPIELAFINPARLKQLKEEAMAADIDDMRSMRAVKRYALTVIFIYIKMAMALDDLTTVLISWTRNIEHRAKENIKTYRLEHANTTDDIISQFYHLLLIVDNDDNSTEKVNAINQQLNGKTDMLIENCKEYLGLIENDYVQWMLKPYKNKRSLIFDILDNLTIRASTNDKSIENALNYIQHFRHVRGKEWIALNEDDTISCDLSILSNTWFQVVTGLKREKNTQVTKINLRYYELATFVTLAIDLKCNDAYVEGSYEFDDPNKQYISWDMFYDRVDDFCELLDIAKSPSEYTQSLKNKIQTMADTVDKNYLDNAYLILNKGRPQLKKVAKQESSEKVNDMRKMIEDKMPNKTIIDIIVDVERWLNLSVHFKPHSGYESKIKNYPDRFVASTFAYGCNLGSKQTEFSLQNKFTRKQIAWLFKHHMTEEKLTNVIQKLINQYNKFDLPKKWGSGKTASVDGTFWDMYKQNLLAAHHIRYGRYGGVGYYHVSDQYIALFSQFISCGAHESIYLLDGVIENDADIKPHVIHGDSWAQSEVVFGIAPLLGTTVMPRIKQFKDLCYYKASPNDHYHHIDELFTQKPIDWSLIETHYHDMLRIAISIQQGKIKASTILRRLCAKSRKNKLYFAFRELGRVHRTLFLLNYIHDVQLRQKIQAATCKSEEFNQFIDWICFGGNGIISDNLRLNQLKIIRLNHFVANCIVFHNVVFQTKAINSLRRQGIIITDEVLASLAPYWTKHINRFGIFQLDINQEAPQVDYKLIHHFITTDLQL